MSPSGMSPSGGEDILLQAAMAVMDETYPNRNEVIRIAVELYGQDAIMQIVNLLGSGSLGSSNPSPPQVGMSQPSGGIRNVPMGPLGSGISAFEDMMGSGGIAEFAAGGYVGGNSGGMDDVVPAVTDGVAPAKLSSGEFVIPADVVSHIGDGNNENGASKLHDMMSRVRAFKTGNVQQPSMIPDNMIFPT